MAVFDYYGNRIDTDNPFATLKLGVLGDSITWGEYGQGNVQCPNSFMKLLEADFASVENKGIRGSCVSRNWSQPMVGRYTTLANDLDVIMLMGGTNDAYVPATIGDASSTTTSEFNGALNTILTDWVSRYANKRIVLITPPQFSLADTKGLKNYADAIKSRAEHYAIPCLDLFGTSGIDMAHNGYSAWSTDGIHPNELGHKRIHDCIIAFLKTVMV